MAYELKDLVKDTVTGNVEFISQDERNKRIQICNVCEYNRMKVCAQCGCMIDLKTKLKKAECPIGKW